MLASIGLLFFLSQPPVAGVSLWGLALLLAVLNVALIFEGREAGLRELALGGRRAVVGGARPPGG